jgi:AAHS family 4-hydroxybenzoate transporter-like MFS transporter
VTVRVTLALCAFAAFLDGYDVQALGLAIPGLAADLHVAPTAFAAALSLSLAGMAMGAMFLAPWADRLGRQRLMISVLLLIGATTLGATTSTSSFQLALWRTLTGLGMGALLPLAITVAAEAADSKNRTFLVTLVTSCTAVGSVAASFAAPSLEGALGWKGIFYLGAAMPLCAALLFLLRGSSPRPEEGASGTSRGKGANVTALFSEQFRFRTTLLWVIFFISLMATYSLISWLPTLLTEAGWTRGEAQRATGFLALGSIIGGLLLARAADRGHPAPALSSAYLLATMAFVGVGVAPASKVIWAVLIFAIGAGSIGSQLALGALAASFYPARIRASGVGWSSGIGRAGSILGPLALAGMMTAQLGSSLIIATLAAPMLICAFCVLQLTRALKHEH